MVRIGEKRRISRSGNRHAGVLLENLFIDHSSDLNSTAPPSYDLSKAIGEGIAKAFSLSGKVLYKVIAGSFKDVRNAEERKNFLASKGIDSVIVEAVVSGEKWYRVQAGAFQSKASAEARLKEVKEAGISDAYILTGQPSSALHPMPGLGRLLPARSSALFSFSDHARPNIRCQQYSTRSASDRFSSVEGRFRRICCRRSPVSRGDWLGKSGRQRVWAVRAV